MKAAFLVVLAAACGRGAPSEVPQPDAVLHLVDRVKGTDRTFTKRALAKRGLSLVTGYDPYYQREKRFWAVALDSLLKDGLGNIDGAELVFRAADGYAVPFVASKLSDGTAWLALADADHPSSWDVIGPRRADPAPFYVVWSGADRADLEVFPRPWAVERIERASFEQLYAHMVPVGVEAQSAAMQGFQIFRTECVACHAMNREGGRIGPELNVPQSIVEYRPRAQIKAYIRDPLTFRYSAMPAHPDLGEPELDALLAYFDNLRDHKHDPERAP